MCNHLKRVTRDLVTSSARCTVTLRTPGLSVGAGGPGVIKASEPKEIAEIYTSDTPVSSSVTAGLVRAKVDLA